MLSIYNHINNIQLRAKVFVAQIAWFILIECSIIMFLLSLSSLIFLLKSVLSAYPIGKFNLVSEISIPLGTIQLGVGKQMILDVQLVGNNVFLIGFNTSSSSISFNQSIIRNPEIRYSFSGDFLISYSQNPDNMTHEEFYHTSTLTYKGSNQFVNNYTHSSVQTDSLLRLGNNNQIILTDLITFRDLIKFDLNDQLTIKYFISNNPSDILIVLQNNTIGNIKKQNNIQIESWFQITQNNIKTISYASNKSRVVTSELEPGSTLAYFRVYQVSNHFGKIKEFTLDIGETSILSISSNKNDDIFCLVFTNYTYRICSYEKSSCYNYEGNDNYQDSGIYPNNYSCTFLNSTHLMVFNSLPKVYIFEGEHLLQMMETKIEEKFWPEGIQSIAEQIISANNSSSEDQVSQQSIIYIRPKISNTSTQLSSSAFTDVLSFPNIKKLFKIFNPLFLFIEDYWFFSHHNRTYSYNVQKAFDLIREINQAKILPTFCYQITEYMQEYVSYSKYFNVTEQNSQTPLNFRKYEGSNVNFISNTQNILIWNYLYSLICFFLLKIGAKICPDRFKIPKQYLVEKSQNSILWIFFIQSNLQFLSFMAACQLQIPSSKFILGKVQIVFTLIITFCLIFYSVAGYFFVRIFLRRKYWRNFLEYKHLTRNSCNYMALNITLRSFLMGFVHGYYLENPNVQIYLIIMIDVALIICFCMYWRTGICNMVNIMLLLYLVIRTIFDVVVLNQIAIQQNILIIELILIFSMLLVILMLFFWLIFVSISENFERKSVKGVNQQPETFSEPSQLNENNKQQIPVQADQKKQDNAVSNKIKYIKNPLQFLVMNQSGYSINAADKIIKKNDLKFHFRNNKVCDEYECQKNKISQQKNIFSLESQNTQKSQNQAQNQVKAEKQKMSSKQPIKDTKKPPKLLKNRKLQIPVSNRIKRS